MSRDPAHRLPSVAVGRSARAHRRSVATHRTRSPDPPLRGRRRGDRSARRASSRRLNPSDSRRARISAPSRANVTHSTPPAARSAPRASASPAVCAVPRVPPRLTQREARSPRLIDHHLRDASGASHRPARTRRARTPHPRLAPSRDNDAPPSQRRLFAVCDERDPERCHTATCEDHQSTAGSSVAVHAMVPRPKRAKCG